MDYSRLRAFCCENCGQRVPEADRASPPWPVAIVALVAAIRPGGSGTWAWPRDVCTGCRWTVAACVAGLFLLLVLAVAGGLLNLRFR